MNINTILNDMNYEFSYVLFYFAFILKINNIFINKIHPK